MAAAAELVILEAALPDVFQFSDRKEIWHVAEKSLEQSGSTSTEAGDVEHGQRGGHIGTLCHAQRRVELMFEAPDSDHPTDCSRTKNVAAAQAAVGRSGHDGRAENARKLQIPLS